MFWYNVLSQIPVKVGIEVFINRRMWRGEKYEDVCKENDLIKKNFRNKSIKENYTGQRKKIT